MQALPDFGATDPVYDWCAFDVVEQVVPRGIHMMAFPYIFNTATVTPADLLVGADFSATNPERSVLKKYLAAVGAYATYFPGNPSDLAWVNPMLSGNPSGGAYYDLVLIDEVSGAVRDRKSNQFDAPVGSGYWLIVNTPTPVNETYPTLENYVSPQGYVFDGSRGCRMRLYAGWNMVGNPYTHPVALSNIVVNYQGDQLVFWDAVAAGWVSQYVYGYNASGPIGYEDISSGDAMQPYRAYWFRALVGGTGQTESLFLNILP